MKITITGDLDEENRHVDPDDSTGLTDDVFVELTAYLVHTLGFYDVEIQAHDS